MRHDIFYFACLANACDGFGAGLLLRQMKHSRSMLSFANPIPIPLKGEMVIPDFTHRDLPDETLWVLDGTSMLFKAFFGKGSTSYLAADGATEVAAVQAMGIELAQFISMVRPSYLAMAFDVNRNTTFRRQMMPSYKAQRPPHPPDLLLQTPLAIEMVKALGVTCFSKEGFEADDVMATLAHWGRSIGLGVVLVSDDKDMWQLVRERVHIMTPRRNNALAGELEVLEKFGLKPLQLTDLVGLMGDSADNIPGIYGVGRKGAVALLQEFGTVESLFNNLDSVRAMNIRGANGLWKRLSSRDARDTVMLCKNIATLRDDVPLLNIEELKSSQLRYRGADKAADRVMQVLGFTAPLRILKSKI